MSPMRSQTLRLLTAVAGVAVAIGLFALTLLASDNGAITFTGGDDVFDAGRPEALASAIERDGPILFPDLVGGRLPIFLQHQGDDLGTGWVALLAVLPGCDTAMSWEDPAGGDGEFVDPCSGDTVPADGGDRVTTYDVTVTTERVRIDLRGSTSDD